MKPRLLLSNDDSISSPFLPTFAKALAEVADVSIVVPAKEQSWIGRAYSRHCELEAREVDFHGLNCLTVSGTPADCVNIALSHFFTDIDVVVSGLNIGQNIGLPLLWSSGTFAAAAEAAGFGYPAFAFSMRLDHAFYDACRLNHEPPPPPLQANLDAASQHAAEFVIQNFAKIPQGHVENVNYPIGFTKETPFLNAVPAKAMLTSLYYKSGNGKYKFKYAFGKTYSPQSTLPTDLECLDSLKACHSTISI